MHTKVLDYDCEVIVCRCTLKVCDGAGDPCDSVCGGAGCGKCGGGVSCDEGAVTKSIQAIDLANQSESILVVKKREIESIYNRVGIISYFTFRASLRLRCSSLHDFLLW